MAVTSERPSNRVLVVFGATGDLAARKLFPALYCLFREALMPASFAIIGSGRHPPGTDEDFRTHVRDAIARFGRCPLDDQWEAFAGRSQFVASSAVDGSELARAVHKTEREVEATGERLIYLSVPPGAMHDMVRMLGTTGLADHASVIAEKPFGHDLASAKELNAVLHSVLDESSIYRSIRDARTSTSRQARSATWSSPT